MKLLYVDDKPERLEVMKAGWGGWDITLRRR